MDTETEKDYNHWEWQLSMDCMRGLITRMPTDPKSIYISLIGKNKKAKRDADKHLNRLYQVHLLK